MAFYSKLPTVRGTRILTFARVPPNAPDSAVYCNCSVISIDSCKPYAALSYVWGDATTKQYDLICNGVAMKITYNLWAALKAIRTSDPSEDTDEKNVQVAMMGDIYARSMFALVWVGAATKLTGEFFKAAEVVTAGYEITVQEFPEIHQRSLLMNSRQAEGLLTSHLLDCGDDIARRPWFERVWTFQEIRLAPRAVLKCDNYKLNFADFLQTVNYINKYSVGQDLCGARLVNVSMFAPEKSFQSLFRLLAITQTRKATDLRDKLFSLLSMLPHDLYGFMKPNYYLTKHQVFTYASRVCLEIDGEINILAGAVAHYLPIENTSKPIREKDTTLPSWVVDWGTYNSTVYSLQNLSRPPHLIRKVQNRQQRGESIDLYSSSVNVTGTIGGRLFMDSDHKVIYLVEFPRCVLDLFSVNSGRGIPLSDQEFLRFWSGLHTHDSRQCACTKQPSYVAYQWRGIASTVQTGDFYWTTELLVQPEELTEPQSYSLSRAHEPKVAEERDETIKFRYALRAVPGNTPCFQLVGKAHDLRPVGVDGHVRGDLGPFAKFQANFTLT
ncbi:hypothetical protein ONZ45_g16488 [Pleurotus djamor]|nr:hypothetical protein ONZ45_g16488 [Pleurotus djamor]